ncbi:hypothetical protein DE146DRAFT_777400 [Phaeosphaeria sp. MPI-PUGE-AT-0046c]|nr:hypothetical protein DE146DRAFT_777400 [Phaeosphaeria sp. MPI-PUGE-AT-0046c]
MELPYRPNSTESVSLREELEKPWKYVGYKLFSRWIASDPSFMIVRRFGALNARVALSLQDEIVELEEKLDYMDKVYSSREVPDAHNGTFRDDPFDGDNDRKMLIREVLPAKLSRYNEFLNGYSQLMSHGLCRSSDVDSVRRWLRVIRPAAIDERESEYIDHDGDLVQLHPQNRYLGRDFLSLVAFGGGRWNRKGIPWLQKLFRREAPNDIISLKNESTEWTNDQRMARVATVLVSLSGLAMLIGPIWILASLQSMKHRLAVVSAFIVIFFTILAAIRSRIYENLAATAAYSAVLVVFLQAGTESFA